MKKLFTSVVLACTCLLVFGQSARPANNEGVPVNIPGGLHKFRQIERAAKTAASNDTFFVFHAVGANDTTLAFIYRLNERDTTTNSLGAINVFYDTLHNSIGTTKAYLPNHKTKVDSIHILCGHNKTSAGTVTDSLLYAIYDLSTGSTMWDTVVTLTSDMHGATNSYTSGISYYSIPCKYEVAAGVKFGLLVSFRGPANQDSFGIIFGFKNQGTCNTSPTSPYSARLSTIPYNSIRFYNKIDTSQTSTPVYAFDFPVPNFNTGFGFFRDCNNNGSYDSGSNEEELPQSALTGVDLILIAPVGIEEGILSQNLVVYPNPSKGQFNVSMNLDQAIDLNITISDIQGRVVYTENVNSVNQLDKSIDLSGLNKGVYLFRAATAQGSAIQKIVIE